MHTFKPRIRASCNELTDVKAVEDWFPSSHVFARVATNTELKSIKHILLQATYSRELQRRRRPYSEAPPAFKPRIRASCNVLHHAVRRRCGRPSSHVFARVATKLADKVFENEIVLQATYSRELQQEICTNMVAHARITLCILTFSSVLSAFQEKTDDHFLDFGTGSRP